MSETRIVSFLFRFVQPEPADGDHPWHAVVRHVQSREELRFTDIDEALRFMNRYIPLHAGAAPAGEES